VRWSERLEGRESDRAEEITIRAGGRAASQWGNVAQKCGPGTRGSGRTKFKGRKNMFTDDFLIVGEGNAPPRSTRK